MQVRIVEFAAVAVAALEHYGPAGQLDQSVRRFIEWRTHSGQSPVQSSRTFGIPHGNPQTTPPEEFRFVIAGEVHEAVAPNTSGVHERVIAGGRYAVVRHVGTTDLIGETIYPLYRDWLPASGEILGEQPMFFHYLNVFPQVSRDEQQTDIYLALR